MVSPSRLGRLLLLLAGCCAPATAFALAPARAPLASVCLRSAAAPLARSDLQPRMQVVDAPVKIPDTFNPDLAPSKPSSDKANEKGKKYKLLLFNDNVNRREYVARILVQNIPDLQQADAYLVMQKAHKAGMAVVGVWVFEMAEAYCESLKTGGLICSVTEESD